jgi:hypothetical protein
MLAKKDVSGNNLRNKFVAAEFSGAGRLVIMSIDKIMLRD